MVNVEESIVAQKMKKENSNVHIKKKLSVLFMYQLLIDQNIQEVFIE